jgi:hypothetical protein
MWYKSQSEWLRLGWRPKHWSSSRIKTTINFSNLSTGMNKNTKIILVASILPTMLAGLFMSGQLASAGSDQSAAELEAQKAIPLKEAKLNIEHNAKDRDTGFQGFLDSDGWNRITVTDPKGNKVLEFRGEGELGELGLTELFFESVEPENRDVPISELLKTLPEGEYTFRGSAIEAGDEMGTTIGSALLTHDIPRGPPLVSPAEDATVPFGDVVFKWKSVEKNIDGTKTKIIAYQLIVEKDEEPDVHMIGNVGGLSMYLPATTTSIKIPAEFFEPGADYEWEVLAIEESGNQSIMSSSFSTSD